MSDEQTIALMAGKVAELTDERDALQQALADTHNERAELVEALEDAREVLLAAPELNMSNFDIDEVSALNTAACEAYVILDAALRSHAPK